MPGGITSKEATIMYLHDLMTRIIQATPRDTNRLVRGWIEAANTAGVGPFAAPELKDSQYLDRTKRDLARQLNRLVRYQQMQLTSGRWQTRVDGQGTGKPTKWYRKLVKDIERAKKQIETVDGTSIKVINKGRRVAITVRNKVYGGTGTLYFDGQRWLGRFTNKEPHASIINRTHKSAAGYVKQAMRDGQVQRVRNVSRKMFAEAQKLTRS
jgi:hypothetical protein